MHSHRYVADSGADCKEDREVLECGNGSTSSETAEHRGKIAEIDGEDGVINLTSVVFADDTVNMGANNANIQDRGKTAQESSDYAGCHTNAGKSFLGALIKNIETGEFRKPTSDENIYYKRLDSELVEGCQLLGPLDRVRYLGWFTAMSNEVDESFKQMKEECDERLEKMASNGAREASSCNLLKLQKFHECCIECDTATLEKNQLTKSKRCITEHTG